MSLFWFLLTCVLQMSLQNFTHLHFKSESFLFLVTCVLQVNHRIFSQLCFTSESLDFCLIYNIRETWKIFLWAAPPPAPSQLNVWLGKVVIMFFFFLFFVILSSLFSESMQNRLLSCWFNDQPSTLIDNWGLCREEFGWFPFLDWVFISSV